MKTLPIPAAGAFLLVLIATGAARGQTSDAVPCRESQGRTTPVVTNGFGSPAGTDSIRASSSNPACAPFGHSLAADCLCTSAGSICRGPQAGFFAGAEFLLLRPHVSEAIAFARGRQTLSTADMEGRELHFDYEPSFRAIGGYRLAGGDELKLTYWHFRSDTSASGGSGPGEFLVDPFGNIVGSAVVIDPSDSRFGTIVTGGDHIRTRAVVKLDVYDLEYMAPLFRGASRLDLSWCAGIRIARIDQSYRSQITSTGGFFAGGDFSADFIGAGPRIGLQVRRCFGEQSRFSIFARCYGSLLVGEYDADFSASVTTPVPFRASQNESLTRTIPVVEAELGAAWHLSDSVTLSMGWLFQAWFDLGASGGRFGGFFTGGDDANIMSFDGLFLRSEIAF